MTTPNVQTEYKLLNVTSREFKEKEMIPGKYTCDGRNINPPLDVGEIPEEAKSLVLIVEDPDASSGSWLHWLVWDIPITHHIRENEIPGTQGINDFRRVNYGGPCPPSGTHRYFFKIYALDDLLNLPEGSGRKEIENAMHNHIIAYGELAGFYKKAKAR